MLQKKVFRVILRLFIAVLVLIVCYYGWTWYHNAFTPNTPVELSSRVVLIPQTATLNDVVDSLKKNDQLLKESSFRWTAAKMNYHNSTIRAGRYIISPATSNRILIGLLRSGKQTPLSVTIQNVRTIDQLCARVGAKLEFDSIHLAQYFETRFDSLAGTVPETRLTRFIPNTYEFYWTVSPEDFSIRMIREYDRFWNDERKAKSETIGLTPEEVYTLASIIEKETNHDPEKPRMAGVYLNRLRDGIPLQADPTIVFALGDFELRRVLHGHLDIESSYNTYRNAGLPPGPIFMPGIPSLDAVLNREEHDYLYFCAKPAEDGPGHAYAVTFQAHHQNATRYRNWLNRRGIN